MNPSRRTIFAALALPAAVAPSLALAKVSAAEQSPDAALVALGKAWAEQRALCDRLNAQSVELDDDGRASVPMPEALRIAAEDAELIAFPPRRLGDHYDTSELERFRRNLAAARAEEAYPGLASWRRRSMARLEEVVSAKDRYDAAVEAAREANGANAALKAFEAAAELESATCEAIRTATATTLAGFAVKARVDLWYMHEDEQPDSLMQLAVAA